MSSKPESLEVGSIDGWTPLLVAACRSSLETAKVLLDAGANIYATDPLGRNMLHLLLVGPGGGICFTDAKDLSSFLQSMDDSARETLMQQRCAESPGGLTPLERWIFTRPLPNVLFSTMLQLSNTSILEVLDGAGCTPLHTVCFRLFYTL